MINIKLKSRFFYSARWFVLLLLFSCSDDNFSENQSIENGNLDNTFIDTIQTTNPKTEEEIYEQELQKLQNEGWNTDRLKNGLMPDCYNFKPQYGDIDNRLEITVGSGTDVVLKLMEQGTDACIRYVYVNSGSTYIIRNIPEGVYYLKLAYGRNWMSKVENKSCIGRFLKRPLYEKGLDFFDFNVTDTEDGYSIPSYTLQLDVISNEIDNSFNSNEISENEFNR